MANGVVHVAHARTVAAVTCTAWLASIPLFPMSAIICAGLPVGALLALVFGPDTDLHSMHTYHERRLIARLSVLGHLLIWYLQPWAFRCHHRHWLSHAPLVSTLGRLVYLVCPPAFCVPVDLAGWGRQASGREHMQTLIVYVVWLAAVVLAVRLADWRFVASIWPLVPLWFLGVYAAWLVQDLVHLHFDGWWWKS